MTRWGMAIDLKKCLGCYSCVIGCKQVHGLPPKMFWNRVLTAETGAYPQVTRHAYPVLCNHCKDAPCVKACPSGAAQRRADGIVITDADQCVGCGYCVIACPYQQRTKHEGGKQEYFPGQGLTKLETMSRLLYPLQPGTAVKCNFCIERIDEGIRKGLKPGVDREATPVCVNNCPTKARLFGDLASPASNVSTIIRVRRGFQLHPDLGTDPSVYYCA
jgi:phenylacetyl-CoA:acceptor oxidoreductase 27-kDa subunit